MKNSIRFVMVILVLFLAVPAAVLAAGTNSGTLTVDKNNVAVSLHLPEGKTGGITSLRLQLRVSVVSGSMGEPAFTFYSAVKSKVRDARISKEKDGSYLVDIIVSGKKEQKLFVDSEDLKLGTLRVAPVGQNAQIRVEFASQKDGKPAVTYVDSDGLNSIRASLSKADAVIVKSSDSTPVQSRAPQVPDSGAGKASGKKLKLTVSVKNGSRRVAFRWTKDEGADGYVLFRYDASVKKYVGVKTFAGAGKVSYSRTYRYGKKYSFKVCSYKKAAGGTKVYGTMSAVSKVKMPPARVKGVAARSAGYMKTELSWKKVSKAKGYQIYGSRKKNGPYSRMKTVSSGSTKRIRLAGAKNKKISYYKIRAYIKGANKKRVYGRFSQVISPGQ